MTDLYAATSKHLLLRQYPSAISTVHALLNDLRSRHPFIYNRPERASSTTPALLLQWESYPYSTIQALKLLCTVYVSAWSGGVTATEVLRKTVGKRQDGPQDVKLQALAQALPPNSSSPNAILETTLALCLHTLASTQPAHLNANKGAGLAEEPTSSIINLPPSLLLTFLLACIKISSSSEPSSRSSATPASQQEESAIPFARKLFEDWLAVLPDEALYSLSQARPMRTPRKSGRQAKAPLDSSTSSLGASMSSISGNQSDTSPSASTVLVDAPSEDDQDRSMLLQFKKDYLRLVEVYVLEVLPRQDDWDIASDFVMGDFVMGAKRKEQMLKRLHEAKAKHTASATRARRSSANLSRSGGPTSMTTLASSALEGEDMDTETVIAGPTTGRNASRRSSDASTERTARPHDRVNRSGRGHTSIQETSGGAQDATRRVQSNPAEESVPPRSSAHAADTSAIGEEGPVTRAVSSFAALRNRIVEYLDEPLSEPRPDRAEPNRPQDPSRRNRRGQAVKRWNVLRILRPKALAIIGAILAALLARRQYQRRRADQSLQSAGTIGSTIPLWYIINAQWWKDILVFVWQKLRTMFSMGTTLTYV